MENNKVFFNPGDIVRLNKNVSNCPLTMYVVKKETMLVKSDNKHTFVGIRCRWFNKYSDLCEAVFDSKDLELINN